MKDTLERTSALRSHAPRLALLVGLALVWRLILLALASDRIVWGDEPFYLWLGRNFFTGHGYTFTGYHDVHHTPGYPFLSGVLYLITGNMEMASDLLYAVFGALLVVPIYVIAHEMYGRRVASVAGILVSLWPAVTISVLYWGTLTEPPYFFFIYSGIDCGLLALRGRGRWPSFMTGAFLALAYLVRPEAIGYLVAVTGIILVVRLFERQLLSRRTWVTVTLIVVGYLVFFFPYAAYVRLNTGEWMITEKAGVTYVTSKSLAYGDTVTFDKMTWGLDSAGTEVFFFSPESYNVSIVQVIQEDPRDFLRLLKANVYGFIGSLFSVRLFSVWLLPLLFVGWLRRPWTRERLKTEFYLLGAISPVLGFLAFFIQDRYILAIVPGIVVWAASGLAELQDWLIATLRRIWPPLRQQQRLASTVIVVTTLLLVGYLAMTAPAVAQQAHSGSWRPEHRTIGLWMKDNLPAGGVIMTRYPAISFYADKTWIPTPNAPIADVLRYASLKGVDYWVIDERETSKLRPQFAPLLNGVAHPELEAVETDSAGDERLVVLKLKQE